MPLIHRWLRSTPTQRAQTPPRVVSVRKALCESARPDHERFETFDRLAASTFGDDTIRRRFDA